MQEKGTQNKNAEEGKKKKEKEGGERRYFLFPKMESKSGVQIGPDYIQRPKSSHVVLRE